LYQQQQQQQELLKKEAACVVDGDRFIFTKSTIMMDKDIRWGAIKKENPFLSFKVLIFRWLRRPFVRSVLLKTVRQYQALILPLF